MGSKCIAEGPWPLRSTARGTGDGARLANCGSGENEKFGLSGIVRPELLLMFGRFKELCCGGGGVKARNEEFVGMLGLVSLGLGFELTSDKPALEGLDSRMTGG